MIVTSVAVSYERKTNLGNWQHCVVSASCWAKVEEEENAEDVMNFLFMECKAVAAAQVPRKPTSDTVNTAVKYMGGQTDE
jgi:hypothetical protein